MRKASLFSGIAGIDLAAEWAGMETVVFCEREPFPQRVLRKHWPGVPIIDDVYDFTRKELEHHGIISPDRAIDIISAGYPCQPFSVAGKREGKEDDRHLWPEVSRILDEIRPRWFVGENVAGHVTLGLDDVLVDLDGKGYTAQPFIIPAAAVGARHRRDRVFIVAYSGGGKRKPGSEVTSNNIESPKPDLKPRDIVRHRTNKALVKGVVRSISKSGERAQVVWDRKDNPQLPYWETHWAYYRIRLLEKIGDAGMEKGAEG